MRTTKGKSLAIAAIASLSLFTAACGSSDEPKAEKAPATSDAPMADDVAANLVGPGCADYAKAVPDGKGSVSGMAEDPVATAASHNPLLKTLVAAVSGKVNKHVNLVDTLNGAEIEVTGSGDSIEAGGGQAKVICGGVKTANATVYLIDTVMMPPKA